MARWRALDKPTLLSAVETLLGAEPLLRSVPLQDAARRLSWPIVRTIPHVAAALDPGYGLGEAGASATLNSRDQLTGIIVHVSETVTDQGAEAVAFRQDVFAAAAETLTEAYGPPTDREPGKEPRISWRRSSVILDLDLDLYSVNLALATVDDDEFAEE